MEVHRKDGEIENRPVSKGGRLFDLITYVGIAGVGTFFATIPIAKVLDRGARFGGFHDWISKASQTLGATKPFAETVAKTTRFMQGGNLTLIPVGIMEHFRAPIVNGFNRMLGDKTSPESVKDAPPQTLSSILKARVIAWITVFAGFKGAEIVAGAERYNKVLDKVGHAWANLRKNPAAFESGRTGAEDALATASSATLLYIGSHFFSRKAYEKKAEKNYIEQKEKAQHEAGPKENITLKQVPIAEKPATTISHAQHDAAVTTTQPQHEQPVASL